MDIIQKTSEFLATKKHDMNISEVQSLTDEELFNELVSLTNGEVWIGDINEIIEFILKQSGPFQIAYVQNLYTIIGHHDHMEVEAVLAKPRQRVEALLMTLKKSNWSLILTEF